MSRRKADAVISAGRVSLNGTTAATGSVVESNDEVQLDGKPLRIASQHTTIMLNKPTGYVCSRDGQGDATIYELLPSRYRHLKSVGRLDKYSSGLLLLTDDGDLAHQLTHPSFQKTKVYEVTLGTELDPAHQQRIHERGIQLEDGLSKLQLAPIGTDRKTWQVTMHEGRNRQIRRTFEELGYRITKLHRTHFGNYSLGTLSKGELKEV